MPLILVHCVKSVDHCRRYPFPCDLPVQSIWSLDLRCITYT